MFRICSHMAGITIRDLIEEGATLQVRCTGCGRAFLYQGDYMLRRCEVMHRRMRELQGRLRCRVCQARAELIISFPCNLIERDRKKAGPVGALVQPGPPLWR